MRAVISVRRALCWRSVLLVIAILALEISGFRMNLHAQSGAGSIQGSVTDSTQAVIPGATVNVVDSATGVAASTKTNEVGFYQVPGLFAGSYLVTITAPSMKTYKTTVQLLVAQNAVINSTMTPGAVTEQVEVSGNTIQLTNTDNGTIGSTLENARINQLPMNGRVLLTLVGETTPGVEGGNRANGLMPEAMEYVADGAPLVNRQFGGEGSSTQAQLPDPDSIQEVRVETTNTSAQYSAPATAIITTKSGTNSLHGTFFETARNNAIGIARARQNPSNFTAPHLVRNEFGASGGGPVMIPKIYNGKDKTFWFFAYERFSLAQDAYELVKVPTMAMRSGDFSGLKNSAGVLQQLYDPSTTASSSNCNGTGVANKYCRTPFANNTIPAARLNSVAKVMFDIMPKPTTADNPLVTGNINWPGPTYQVIPQIPLPLDHTFTEKTKAYLRYGNTMQTNSYPANYPSAAPRTIAADGIPAGSSGIQVLPIATFSGSVGATHVFSPTFFSETVLSQQWFSQYFGVGGNPYHNYEADLGLPNNFGEVGLPYFSGLIMSGGLLGNQQRYGESQIISNLDENLTKTIGSHQMQFGGRYRFERFGFLIDRQWDTIAFNNKTTGLDDPSTDAAKSFSNQPNTGFSEADFFLGSAGSYNVNLIPGYAHFHDMEIDAYFQDNYHISRNLTLNLGLRYENHPAAWVKDGLAVSFDPKNKAIVLPNPTSYYIARGATTQAIISNLTNIGAVFETPSAAGYPNALLRSYPLTFSPRVGFAYQPFGGRHGTVIRGAYGRYIYPAPIRNTVRGMPANLPFQNGHTQDYTSAAQSPDGLANYQVRNPQLISMGKNSSDVVNSSTTNAILPGIVSWVMAPNQPPDYVTQVNFTIEQAFKGNSALRLTWLWCHGTNLDHYYYFNWHPSTYVWEMQTGKALPSGGPSTIGTDQYAITGTGSFDKTTYGSAMNWNVKDGWSNDNALQVNYQKLFHHGVAYQIAYVWSKPFRLGGNFFRDGTIYTAQAYFGNSGGAGTMTSPYGNVITPAVPPARPSGIAPYASWHDLVRWEQYNLDSAIPLHHITFNGIVDLPVGRGKRFLGDANRFLDELVGGFQIAGDGGIVTETFQPSAGYWGSTSPLKVYKQKAPITDCRSGVCRKEYLWFNGYLASTSINTSNGVSGLPGDYTPYSAPIDTTVGSKYYNQNTVNIALANGTVDTQPYSPGPVGSHPFSHKFLNGPVNWSADLSLFKVFPITERTNLRFNMDAFNVFNVQGYNNPSASDGTQNLLSSHNTPRQVQFTLRYTF